MKLSFLRPPGAEQESIFKLTCAKEIPVFAGMKLRWVVFFSFFVYSSITKAQELYPLNEPASNVPKGVLGVRLFEENYKVGSRSRNVIGARLMYGLTPRLTVLVNATTSNHHYKELPRDLITHTHLGNQTILYTNKISRNGNYPFLFSGFHFYGKYRFISMDGEGTHFRVAAYGEYSLVKTAHDEAESNLMLDNSGYGYGVITTWLHHKLAISLNAGVVIPKSYVEYGYPTSYSPGVKTEMIYGRQFNYNLSLGYLVFPKTYSDYRETNYNVYLEFIGRSYDGVVIIQDREKAKISNPVLMGGNYIEIHPGIQRIVKSNLRIEASVGFNLINQSYARSTPTFNFGIQRYFYFR